ncbi:MAG TPA: aminotransferase class V-fold PLP-dependent enzyme [Methanocorpusculum sp.]|nr:aminotransferase class V-fold PLP-dependent enzyme [Methanocorpusculum sp.]
MDNHPLIYCNNAATTWPKPQQVKDALLESLNLPAYGSGRTAGTEGTDYISQTRASLGRLLHCPDEQICFSHNATDALNILIAGFLANHQGCHVLTTELDHNSVLRPLHEFQTQKKCTYSAMPFDKETGKIDADTIDEYLTAETKLAVLTHASNVLGTVQDIEKMTKILHDHGVFVIVDGSQSAGHIPIDLQNLGADAFVFTGHKGLFGIPGTGGFWIRDYEQVEPTKYGGTGSFSEDLMHPRSMPDRFETGTQNYTGLAALAAGISFVAEQTVETIHEQGQRQSAQLIRRLKDCNGIAIHQDSPDLPIISLTVDGVSSDDLGFILSRKYHIITRSGLHCGPLVHRRLENKDGSLRLSLSAFTTDAECDAVCSAFEEMFR